jgi:excisionase family DNA binding protein
MGESNIIIDKLDSIESILSSWQPKPQRMMLNSDEASSYLGISVSTLYKHTSLGNIAHYKPNGKLMLFKMEDLKAWIEARRIPSNQEISSKA